MAKINRSYTCVCMCVQWHQDEIRHHKPMVILLTGSEDWYKGESTEVLREIMEAEQHLPEPERLTVHVIESGPGVDQPCIKEMAAMGNGSHMTLQAAKDMDRLSLVKAFAQIAAHGSVCLAKRKQGTVYGLCV